MKSKSRHFSVLVSLFGAALAAIALLAPAAQAAKEPAPGYGEFKGCPAPEEIPTFVCQYTKISSGHFQMGSKDVPIKNPITLVAGVTEEGQFVANQFGGMSKSKQLVPGGITGLTGLDWLVDILGLEALKLYATTEIAGALGSAADPTLKLPIRVHLENPVLGPNCYVGTFTNPIVLNLTVGTTSPPAPNKPISGKAPEESEDPEREGVFLFKNGTFVDNSFAAPGASGCQLNLGLLKIGIDGLVNSQSGLPAAAGTNETIQNFESRLALTEFVFP